MINNIFKDLHKNKAQLKDYALNESNDQVCPVAAMVINAKTDERTLAANSIPLFMPRYEINKRTEYFYNKIEHAEVSLLEKLELPLDLDPWGGEVWVTLFPCDACMKMLIERGVKVIYYIDDHEERGWSKRSHELAKQHGVRTIRI